MQERRLISSLLVAIASLLLAPAAYAQDAPPADGADVWQIIEDQWNAEEKGDRKWPERLLVEDFSGWNKNSPAPRGKQSTIYWNRFAERQGSTVAHELYPLSIVVNGDVAIAHYLYSIGFEAKDGDIETTNGRFTDILVRTEDGWRFLAWHGGADEE